MAQLTNTSISGTAFINLPAGSSALRPGSPIAGMARFNTDLNRTEYWDGLAWRSIADTNPEATGGTIADTEIGGVPYRIHYFTTVGNTNFVVTKPGEVEYLIVAGGGGGSDTGSGGGGAGGFLTGFATVTAQTYTITVGGGGAGTNSYFSGTSGLTGGKGGNSVALGFTALGGGGGGGYRTAANSPDMAGGSGGGHRGTNGGVGGLGTAGQGNNGGNSVLENGQPASGGGGAGGVGGDAATGFGGKGGAGLLSTISGNARFYAGGGGGSGGYGNPYGSGIGGVGGGGNGGGLSRFVDDPYITNGMPNTGGGGGGQGYNGNTDPVQGGGNGGSGIVIIRYRRNASTATSPARTFVSKLPYNYSVIDNGLTFLVNPADPLSWDGTTLRDIAGGRTLTLGANTIVTNIYGATHFASNAGPFGTGALDTGYRFGTLAAGDKVVPSNAPWTAITSIFKASIANPNNWWHILSDGESGDIFTINESGTMLTSMNSATGSWASGSDITYNQTWADMQIGWNFCGVQYDQQNSRVRMFIENGNGVVTFGSWNTSRTINSNFCLRNFHGWGSAQSSYHSDGAHGPTAVYRRSLGDNEIVTVIRNLRTRYGY